MLMALRTARTFLRARKADPVRPHETVHTPFRVAVADLDAAMHMNNGRYLTILDLGRFELFVRTGLWQVLRRHRWQTVVVVQTATYHRSLRHRQQFDVATRLLGTDARNLYVEQHVTVDGASSARAVIGLRLLDRDGRSVPPDTVAQTFPALTDLPDLPDWVHDWAQNVRAAHAS